MSTETDRRERGFSLIELLIVLLIVLVVAAFVIPNVMLSVSNIRLRASAGDLSGLMQQARIMAAKNNTTYAILYGIRNGAQIAYIDLNSNGSFDATEPSIQFSGTTVPAAGAPSGGGGQPTAYVLPGDTGTLSYDNTNTLGYTGRGLPCRYDTTTTPATCSTPPARYFVYYLTDTRVGGAGWAAVAVTKSGRTKIITWNGAAWN
ncbi:MAG: prepilin-type N-terminal cleavage/methylation domain-containing protein [Acidobacteriota bacterium]|nr:prepilin-type N-terminal cleavage/methylation domain-containing protein [Acidobacteriota bacterium]